MELKFFLTPSKVTYAKDTSATTVGERINNCENENLSFCDVFFFSQTVSELPDEQN